MRSDIDQVKLIVRDLRKVISEGISHDIRKKSAKLAIKYINTLPFGVKKGAGMTRIEQWSQNKDPLNNKIVADINEAISFLYNLYDLKIDKSTRGQMQFDF